MLMVQSKPTRITDHGHRLLNALRGYGDWMTRSDIAKATERNRLTPYDLAMLELLKQEGLIEIEQQPGYSALGYRWVYRAKGQG